ncbi:MAG: Fic family protein, partial [Prosthecobacter sp.]|nr:Fic family protein [Prosthecobacter sp.]
SHPWIKFSLQLPHDDSRLWLTLGEIASKVQHLSGAPLRPDVAENLHQIYLAKGVLATTAIEGNTLSEEQVRHLIEGKLDLPESQKYLQQEAQNILDLCNQEARLLLDAHGDERSLCPELIRHYNRGVLKGLELQEGTVAGEIRTHSVVVGNVYRGAPAEDCEYLLDRLCTWLNSSDFVPPDEELRIPFALIKSIVAHVYLAWIHPFGDGNGRTARMMEFHVLFANGIPLPAAHLLSDHYNLTRTEYYRQLAKASASGGDLLPFIRYALRGFLHGLRGQIALVREQQMRVAWENYVHGQFRKLKSSPTQKRRRELVFDLTDHGSWVEVSDIPLLTPKLAREYAKAGDRMVQRDLNALSKMQLILRRHGKVTANRSIIQAFLPRRVRERESNR